MGIGQILGIGKREGGERKKIKEVAFLDLENPVGGRKHYVVAERNQLMGYPDKMERQSQIITFEPGDEILVIEEYNHEPNLDHIWRDLPAPDRRLQVMVHNSKYPIVGPIYYFTLKQLQGRTIKIDKNAALEYTKSIAR